MMTKKRNIAGIVNVFSSILFLCFVLFLSVGCQRQGADPGTGEELSGKLVIFHAGSLSVPFEQLSEKFTDKHPGVKVFCEAAGSRACARKVVDLGKRCDVLAVADSKVIKNLLMPAHTDWYVEFATNEMVLVYNPEKMGELNIENLPSRVLAAGQLYRADPDLDPCGYRTLMVWQLMESYYNHPGLYEKLLQISPAGKTRPKETDLLALYESGQMDCFFIYRSVAQQHRLSYLILPGEVNLSDPRLESKYSQAQVEVSGRKPGTTITVKAAPIVYGITIPGNAEHKETAEAFVRFVLGPEGKAIMKANGQGELEEFFPADALDAKKLIIRDN